MSTRPRLQEPPSKYSLEPLRYRLLSFEPNMQRREFITITGVAAAAIPMTALAQRSETAVVDVLNPDGPKSDYVKGRGEYKAREGGRHLNAKLKPRTFNERFA